MPTTVRSEGRGRGARRSPGWGRWVVLGLLAGSVAPVAARAEVVPWDRRGYWVLSSSLECFYGGRDPSSLNPSQQFRIVSLAAGLGVAGTSVDARHDLQGEIGGKGGRVLRGRIGHADCGQGTFRFKMRGDFATLIGTMTFGARQGEIVGAYVPDPADRYDVGLRLAFSAAKAGFLKPGKMAVLVAFVENRGPQAIPLGLLLLQLSFRLPVEFQSVTILRKLADFDFGLAIDDGTPQSRLELPIAAHELLVLAIKFRVPEALAGSTLAVGAVLVADPDVHGDLPPVPPGSAYAEIPIAGDEAGRLRLRVTLKNSDDRPIHIFLANDPDPYSDRTRVPPGGAKRITLAAEPGQSFDFAAGRDAGGGIPQVFDTCTTGRAVKSGRGTVEWDPKSFPPFLALRCPGGI